MIGEGGSARVGEVVEDVAALLTEGVRDGHDSRGETAAAVTLRSETFFPPENEGAELAFGMIVGGFDADLVRKGPQGESVFDDVGAGAADAAHAKADAARKKAFNGWSDRSDVTVHGAAIGEGCG